MSTILRSPLGAAAVAVAVLALVCFALIEVAGADEDAPLQLGSEHLGMTSEGIAEAHEAASTERAVDAAIEQSEWTDEDLGDDFACDCSCAEVAPLDPTGVETHAVGVRDYASCVEVAIRGGNGFKGASSVCQTLYPEALQPHARVEEVEAAEPQARIEEIGAAPTTY